MKGAFTISKPQLLEGSACGAFVMGDVEVKVKRDKAGDVKMANAGKTKIKVKAKGPKGTKPRTDADTVTIQCLPRTVACASASGAFLD